MKKLVLSSFAIALIFGFMSCAKKSPNISGKNTLGTSSTTTAPPVVGLPVGDVPKDFTKKALLEEFTGEWCGWCPEGAKIMDDLEVAHPNTFVGVAVHDGDPMEIPAMNTYLQGLTGVSGFPNGAVQRADAQGRGSWTGDINSALAQTATCGLSMVTKLKGSTLDADIYIGYNAALPAGSKLTVYVTEDDVPQSSPGAQSNYSSSVVVDANWTHAHVLRGILTSNAGDDFDQNVAKKYTKVSFTGIDLSGMKIKDLNKLHVVAFVNLATAPRDVLNIQSCVAGTTKKWD